MIAAEEACGVDDDGELYAHQWHQLEAGDDRARCAGCGGEIE